MNFDTIASWVKSAVQSLTHVSWLSTLITALIILIVTAIISALVTRMLRHVLGLGKNPLPSSSIFINIARVTVWAIGICVVLSTCFNVNVSAAITALGIGGIAVSLGFQNTLSNLIGGLQISLGRIVEPGDRISVGGQVGTVHDVSWRNTLIVDAKGNRILIPNSVINSESLTKMPSQNDVRMNILIPASDTDISHTVELISKATDEAVNKVALLKNNAAIELLGRTEKGYSALLYFSVGLGAKISELKESVLEAISAHASKIPDEQMLPTSSERSAMEASSESYIS